MDDALNITANESLDRYVHTIYVFWKKKSDVTRVDRRDKGGQTWQGWTEELAKNYISCLDITFKHRPLKYPV